MERRTLCATYADGIRIVYLNVAPIAANHVAFVVNYRSAAERVRRESGPLRQRHDLASHRGALR